MSNTIAHRSHVQHLPLTPVIAVVAVALIAATVIWAINQPESATTTTTTTSTIVGTSGLGPRAVGHLLVVSPVVHPAAVAAPESPVFRHTLLRVSSGNGYPGAYIVGQRHLVEGATLDPVSTNPYGTASYKAPNYPR